MKTIKTIGIVVLSLIGVLLIFDFIFNQNIIKRTINTSLFASDNNKNNTPIDSDSIKNAEIKDITTNNLDAPETKAEPDTLKFVTLRLDTLSQNIEFPETNSNILNDFFQSIIQKEQLEKVIRVLHYGDSQIECDRITSYLRKKLQTQFGGSGCGLVPIVQVHPYNTPMEINTSNNWYRYSNFPKKDTIIKHSRYGIMGCFYSFTPAIEADTTIYKTFDPAKIEEFIRNKKSYKLAYAIFTPSKHLHSLAKEIYSAKLLYGYNKEMFSIKVYDSENIIVNDSVAPTTNLSIKTWNYKTAPANIRIEFGGLSSPEIYGLCFDGKNGIAVDNIPLRGCSGTIFTTMDLNLLQQLYLQLNVRLIILQFGGNVLPYIKDDATENYKKYFSAQLRVIRKICPKIPIIVIGPADMAVKINDEYETIPVLEDVRNALKSASFSNNCAFWDMYLAMGGKNSMARWATAEEPLGEKDFVHFTPNGSALIAKLFYNALILEYNKFLKNKDKQSK